MMIALSPTHIATLAAIEAHERLYCFDGRYQASAQAETVYSANVIDDLIACGLLRKSAVHVKGSTHSVTLTEAGRAKLLEGPEKGGGMSGFLGFRDHPKPNKSDRVYCEDWACPAAVSCAEHFGRSRHYAAMLDRGYILVKPPRDPKADSCAAYRFDRPKKWLAPQPGQITHVPEGSW